MHEMISLSQLYHNKTNIPYNKNNCTIQSQINQNQQQHQQYITKPWWQRRPHHHNNNKNNNNNHQRILRRRAKHKKSNTSSSQSNNRVNSTTSTSVHLFSAFFTTPGELALTLHDWEQSVDRQLRRQQSYEKKNNHHYHHQVNNNNNNIKKKRKKEEEEEDKELVKALSTARLLSASMQRSNAICVDARMTGRALVKKCRSFSTWICPLLLRFSSLQSHNTLTCDSDS